MFTVLAALVGFGGCGGGEEESLTKAEFIKQGDAICRKASTRIAANTDAFFKAEGVKSGQSPSQAQYEEVAEEVFLPGVEERVAALKELNSPPADEARLEALYAAFEDGAAAIRQDIKAFFEEDPFGEWRTLAQAYGFKECNLA